MPEAPEEVADPEHAAPLSSKWSPNREIVGGLRFRNSPPVHWPMSHVGVRTRLEVSIQYVIT